MRPSLTPTNTPTPTPVHQVFQQGAYPDETYSGVTDTFLASYRPDTSWAHYDSLKISGRSWGTERALVHFDLHEQIPTNAQVSSAKLSLYAWSKRSVLGMRVSAYEVTRSWDVGVATWQRASSGEMWGMPGCDEVNTDRKGYPEASRFVYFVNQFYEWEITSAAQRWVADPSNNNGIMLTDSAVSQEVRFRSSEWRTAPQRPKLTIIYTMP